jgi:hypothetical protein
MFKISLSYIMKPCFKTLKARDMLSSEVLANHIQRLGFDKQQFKRNSKTKTKEEAIVVILKERRSYLNKGNSSRYREKDNNFRWNKP